MPNTLVHIALQGGPALVASRGRADLRWVLAGCVVPDVPWMARRAVLRLVDGIDPLMVTAYAFVQSSLVFALVLAGLLACFATRPIRAFAVVGLSSLAHLLLDATQIKLGNGVHLLAPFDWTLIRFDLAWPEAPVFHALSLVGVVLGCWLLVRGRYTRETRIPRPMVVMAAAVLAGAYLLGPWYWLDGPRRVNDLSIATLADPARHVGEEIALDRAALERGPDGPVVRAHDGQWFEVAGLALSPPARISLRGTLTAPGRIEVITVHVHHPWFREIASLVGLALLAAIWARGLVHEARAGNGGSARHLRPR